MKHVALILGSLLAVTACGGKSSSAPSGGGATCEDAAAHVIAAAPEAANGDPAEMTAAAAEICKADAWSADAIECFASKTGEAMEDCVALLTEYQMTSLGEKMSARFGDGDESEAEEME